LYLTSLLIAFNALVSASPSNTSNAGDCSGVGGTSTSIPHWRKPSLIHSPWDFVLFLRHQSSQASASSPTSWFVMSRMELAEWQGEPAQPMLVPGLTRAMIHSAHDLSPYIPTVKPSSWNHMPRRIPFWTSSQYSSWECEATQSGASARREGASL